MHYTMLHCSEQFLKSVSLRISISIAKESLIHIHVYLYSINISRFVCHLRLIYSLGTVHCGIAFTLKNSYTVAFSFGIIMQPTFWKSLCDYDAFKDRSLGFGKVWYCQRIKPLTSLQAAIWLIYSPSVNTMFWPSACRPEKERHFHF